MIRIASTRRPATSCRAVINHHEGVPVCSGSESHVQAWRAWTGCGDGGQVHLIIDPPAKQVWLLPAGEPKPDPRSV